MESINVFYVSAFSLVIAQSFVRYICILLGVGRLCFCIFEIYTLCVYREMEFLGKSLGACAVDSLVIIMSVDFNGEVWICLHCVSSDC